MAHLTSLLLGFPTVLFTVLLGVSLIYWLFVVIGALDHDFLDPGHAGLHDGAVKGAVEGAVKGALEGAAKGVTEGAADAAADCAAEGATEGAHEGIDEGYLAAFFAALNLRKAPITVVLTVFTIFGWLISAIAMESVGPAW